MKALRRIFRFLLTTAFAGALLGLAALAVGYALLVPTLPEIDSLRDVDYQEPLRVVSAEGDLIAEFGERRREPVHIADVPPRLRNAFIAAEDQRFYEHPGVDYRGLMRAIWYVVRTGEKGPGGSTITMQVARNFFLSREQTYLRKAREILLALKIEGELSKDQILELYLNEIYLGQRAYGVVAAAQTYYGKPLAELTLAQSAMIAGLPKAPSASNPIADPQRARQRRSYVLGRMLEQGFIDQASYEEAKAAPVTQSIHELTAALRAPWVAEMARRKAVDLLGAEEAYSGGYVVHTSVQAARQRAANAALRTGLHAYDERHGWRGPLAQWELGDTPDPDALRKRLAEEVPSVGDLTNAVVAAVNAQGARLITPGGEKPLELPFAAMEWARPFRGRNSVGNKPTNPGDVLAVGDVVRIRNAPESPRLAQVPQPEGALVSLDPRDGSVVSLVGGYDFFRSKFNRATQAQRQPGSSFKPFIYSAALANGFTPATLVNDAPVVFEDAALDSIWRPENYSGRFYGPTRLRQALIHSRNLVSIRVLRRIGIGTAIPHLARFGFEPERLPRNLSLALGSASVTPLALARGYAVFANGGFLINPWLVERIDDDEGNPVFAASPPVACAGCPASGDAAGEGALRETAAQGAVSSGVRDLEAGGRAPRALPADNAYLMTTMMRDVVRYGTGRRAKSIGRSDIAGKTGTTNDQRDAWFAGFDHALVTTAWVGFDDLKPLGSSETGSRAALPIWIDFMQAALKGVPEEPLEEPPGLTTVRIDADSGRLTSAENPNALFETFRSGNVPRPADRAGGQSSASEGGSEAPERGLF